MKTYKIILELADYQSPILEIEAKNWQEVCNEVFGKIQIIDTDEK